MALHVIRTTAMTEPIVCRFRYTPAETRAALKAQAEQRASSLGTKVPITFVKGAVLVALVGLVIGAGITGVVRVYAGAQADAIAPWSLTGWFAFAIFLVLAVAAARRLDGASGTVPEHPEQTATVGDDGITLANAHCETRYRWNAYVNAAEVDDAIVLTDTLGTLLVLPARGFTSRDERDRAWAIVRARVIG